MGNQLWASLREVADENTQTHTECHHPSGLPGIVLHGSDGWMAQGCLAELECLASQDNRDGQSIR